MSTRVTFDIHDVCTPVQVSHGSCIDMPPAPGVAGGHGTQDHAASWTPGGCLPAPRAAPRPWARHGERDRGTPRRHGGARQTPLAGLPLRRAPESPDHPLRPGRLRRPPRAARAGAMKPGELIPVDDPAAVIVAPTNGLGALAAKLVTVMGSVATVPKRGHNSFHN